MEVNAGLINFWCSVVVQRGLTHFAYVGCLGELTPFWYISRSQKYYSAAVPLTDAFYKSDYPPKFCHHYESSYFNTGVAVLDHLCIFLFTQKAFPLLAQAGGIHWIAATWRFESHSNYLFLKQVLLYL